MELFVQCTFDGLSLSVRLCRLQAVKLKWSKDTASSERKSKRKLDIAYKIDESLLKKIIGISCHHFLPAKPGTGIISYVSFFMRKGGSERYATRNDVYDLLEFLFFLSNRFIF